MKSGKRPTSIIRIYTVQYSMFIIAAIFFIIGIIRIKNTEVIDAVAWIWLISGTFLFVTSYVYAKRGALIIQKACPHCYGTGYIDMGVGKNKRSEVCPICHGTGKLLNKAEIEWEKEKLRMEREKEKEEEKKQLLQSPITEEEQ
ncbi:MAG: hypothetical protein ACTSQE_00465 [Candidatus Heimdallarchaeaceae archaeon]